MITKLAVIVFLTFFSCSPAHALKRPDVEFKIFQFPSTMIPSIDGDTEDWDIVPDSYKIGTDQLYEEDSRGNNIDTADIDITVRVGWVNGMNRLYFLYEAYDEYWDFSENSLHNDIFELVVDGDLSGGTFIKQMNPSRESVSEADLHFSFHGVHAQNYHIFTPPGNKDWAMFWGAAQWAKDLPYAHHAYSHNLQHGESGRLVLEFWITPFDYAPYEGPENAVISKLEEDKRIGLGWVQLDYDGPGKRDGAYNVTGKTRMYADASDLCAFRLMPLEERFIKPVEAHWTYTIVNMDSRCVAFHDQSRGTVSTWTWDFGDGIISHEQNPLHVFLSGGEKTVILTVEGQDGSSTFARMREIVLK